MNKQLVALGIIGILIAISISGCLENNKEGNGNIITPPSGQVIVTTNKTEFEQNENINFTLFNGKNGSIYLSFGCGEFSINFIEKKTVTGWELFWANDPNIIYDCMGTNTEIKEGESVHLIWKAHCLWVYNESNNSHEYCLVEPGVYRLKFDYFTDATWINVTAVYSNEFTIKEKRELLSSHILIYGDSFAGPLYTKEVNITLNENGYFMTYICKNSSYVSECDCKNVEKNINETTLESYLNFVNSLVDEGEYSKCCDHPWTEIEVIYKDGSEKSFVLSYSIDIETILGIDC